MTFSSHNKMECYDWPPEANDYYQKKLPVIINQKTQTCYDWPPEPEMNTYDNTDCGCLWFLEEMRCRSFPILEKHKPDPYSSNYDMTMGYCF